MNNFFKAASVVAITLVANTVSAQTTASTLLRVNLQDAYSIVIPAAQNQVTIDMILPAHFQNGNSAPLQSNHLQVSASDEFEVKVAATADLNFGSEFIPVSTVSVTPTAGTFLGAGTDPGIDSSFPALPVPIPVNLDATAGTTIITSGSGDIRGYNMLYSIPASETSEYLNRPAGIYTTTVVYAIMPL